MPIFSPNEAPPLLRTLCGQDRSAAGHGSLGHLWTHHNIGKHESKCAECIEIQTAIREFADSVVTLRPDGNVYLIGNVTKAVRDQFNLTTVRARREVWAARCRKLPR